MIQNIGGMGRIIRGVVGLMIIALGWYYHNWWGALGLFLLGEAIFGWCVVQHFLRELGRVNQIKRLFHVQRNMSKD